MTTMLRRGRWLGALALAYLLIFFGGASATGAEPAAADTVDLKALLERVNRLERQNQDLRQELDEHKRQLKQAGDPSQEESTQADDKDSALDPAAVRKIVGDYLREQDTKKKAAEAKAKKEAEEKGYEVGSDLSMKGGWRDGFTAETPGRDYRVHFGGRFQADAGWFAPSAGLQRAFPQAWQDGADFRRLRLRADGQAYEVIDFVVEIEFSQAIQGAATRLFPTDCFLDFTHLPVLGNLAVGHFKEPFCMEDYGTPDSFGVFMERSSADNAFTPDRNLGVMQHDSYFNDSVALAVGVFRANNDARSGNVFDYGDGEYAYTGRVVWMPYYANDGRCWFLTGPAYSRRHFDPDDNGVNGVNASRFRALGRAPVRLNTPPLLDTTALQADHANYWNFQAALNMGPLLLQSEYYYTTVANVRRGLAAPGTPRLVSPDFQGWYAQVSYFLTGEYHPLNRLLGRLQRVRPNENWFLVRRGEKGHYDGCCYGWGAWEVAVRYDWLDLNNRALGSFPAIPGVANSGAAAITSAGLEQDFTFSISCYMNPNTRIQMNYIHAWRGTPIPNQRGTLDCLAVRLWWDF